MVGRKSCNGARQTASTICSGSPVTEFSSVSSRAADDFRTRRALEQKLVLRGYAETRYKAKSWNTRWRVCARIEATTMGLDIRFVVTNLGNGSAEPTTVNLQRVPQVQPMPAVQQMLPMGRAPRSDVTLHRHS
ncbi:hypothetical protein GGE67_001959 [Rhizobium leucaenae]|uniref:Transposase DDE domain-containing protein n=1 Tax=Rhizobium leucaenae TaxID=29450 RepID=A0A7W6ZR85_9HYPH|nr:hypothetical protein [Rhizobium leucaenae]MBB6301350.1 hypothetical protein [Rhizobium leucaenae]